MIQTCDICREYIKRGFFHLRCLKPKRPNKYAKNFPPYKNKPDTNGGKKYPISPNYYSKELSVFKLVKSNEGLDKP